MTRSSRIKSAGRGADHRRPASRGAREVPRVGGNRRRAADPGPPADGPDGPGAARPEPRLYDDPAREESPRRRARAHAVVDRSAEPGRADDPAAGTGGDGALVVARARCGRGRNAGAADARPSRGSIAPPVASAAPATPGRPEAPLALPAAPVTSTTPAPPASAPSAAAVAPPEAVITPEIVEPSSAAPTPPAPRPPQAPPRRASPRRWRGRSR